MARCSAITATGTKCKAEALDGQTWCYNHHPNHADARRRAGTKGGKAAGKGRAIADLAEIKEQLKGLLAGVLSGRIPPGIAVVANQIQNTRLRTVEVERKLRETEELMERIEALEEASARIATERGGAKRWG